MKKRTMRSVASVLLLAFALTACGGNSGGAASTTAEPAAEASTAAEETSEPEAAATEASTEEEAPAEVLNQIIYGTTTEMNGDMGNAWWTNNAADKTLRDLIDDYSVVVTDQSGEFIMNPTVAKSMEGVVNDDGSKTFTVEINEGLKYNNGDEITAKDFVAYALVAYSPAAIEAGAKTNAGASQVVGATAYMNGEVNYVSGLRLLDDYTYSITIEADYIPFFYDMTYASLAPLALKQYASAPLEVKDDGEGAYLDGGELVAEEIDAARWIYEGRISAGPYQMEGFDQAARSATVTINPNYAGNFEGQKPSVERIIIVRAVQATQMDELATGGIDFLSALTGGDEVNAALDLEETGDFYTVNYDRNGYGKLMFQCDFGPTQFKSVRHAVAYLLDRNDFANTFTGGYGSVVHGPYGIAMWMYQDAKEELADRLDTYAYDVAKAIETLEEDGWVLNENGEDYTEGIRYKEVTAEEAGDYVHNVTLADGRILMPLIIEWSSSEGNSVSDLLAVMLANGDQVKEAGMQINQSIMTFEELLNYMYRDATQGEQYGVPTYGMYNLASNWTAQYDQSYAFVTKESNPEYYEQGYNSNFTDSEELDKLSMDMVYGVEAGDTEEFLRIWVDFIDEWNDYLPEIPLYSNIYYDIMNSKIHDLECNPLWDFQQAVVYAYIE